MSAGPAGDLDNRGLIEEILTLRREQAVRLGYDHWAEVSLASKMAEDVNAVEALLEELRAAAYPAAQQSWQISRIAPERHGAHEAGSARPHGISPSGRSGCGKERFDLDQEALRPWFPLAPGAGWAVRAVQAALRCGDPPRRWISADLA